MIKNCFQNQILGTTQGHKRKKILSKIYLKEENKSL